VRTIGPVTRHLPGHEASNIVRPAGPIDPDVGLLVVHHPHRTQPRAAVVVFGLHLNTVGDTTVGETVYSADFPHVLEGRLRKTLGGDFSSLFGAGPCGDINYVDVQSKRTRTTEEIGTLLAETVLAQVPRLQPVHEPALAVRGVRFKVPLQRFAPEQVAQARKDMARAGTKEVPFYKVEEARSILAIEAMPEKQYPLEVQLFRLNKDTAVVTVPGEFFVELGLAIKRASPFKTTLVIELANDDGPIYIPTRKAFTEGGYEVLNSRLEPGSGEQIVEEAVKLLKQLAP
jgi:hypothetical protein